MIVGESDLLGNFNAMTVVRAREYERARNVLRAGTGEGGYVYGRVRGSYGAAYDQVICLEPGEKGVTVHGECTCPVGYNCKHVAAVLLHLTRRRELQLLPKTSSASGELAPTSPQLEGWLSDLETATVPQNEFEPDIAQRLLYVIIPKAAEDTKHPVVKLLSARALKNGEFGNTARFPIQTVQSGQFAKYVRPVDKAILRDIYYSLKAEYSMESAFRLTGRASGRFLDEMVRTGRCFWMDTGGRLLKLGGPRKAKPAWVIDGLGCQAFTFDLPGATILPTAPPWYVEPETGLSGPIESDLTPEVAESLLLGPTILPEHSVRARAGLSRLLPSKPEFWPPQVEKPKVVEESLVICLKIDREQVRSIYGQTERRILLPFAKIEFLYGDARVSGPGSEVRRTTEDGPTVTPRNIEAEHKAQDKLHKLGWNSAANMHGLAIPPARRTELALAESSYSLLQAEIDQRFYRFLHSVVPILREEGWLVDTPGEGEVITFQDSPIVLQAVDKDTDWFELELGVMVDGRKIDVRPVLVKAMEAVLRLRSDNADEDLYFHTAEGQVVSVALSRIRPILQSLIELFGRPETWPDDLKVSKSRVPELSTLDDLPGFALDLPERLKEMADAFAQTDRMVPAFPPEGFKGELRGYQGEGVSWLRFLADFELGGILADDMGLGKTIQTLAHIVSEKEQGRLDRPALIVAPTSTIPNWQAEAARFAPGLSVLTLHGPKRKGTFDSVPKHDIVLTTYPLLARDKAELLRHEFHMAVLDEAQNIKNHMTHAAKAAYEIKCRHRVALSGTPVENRLEELWSLFRFAVPGLLGSQSDFKRQFLLPIEKIGDDGARQRLSRRIRPFVLRRKKEQVALELPPKTLIVDRVELEGEQRDLYESLRLAMDKRVRSLVASKGLDKSRIEVLDALLKLRQVCCDPRLVKLESAKGVKVSAKLNRLMEMVESLVSEGRRALIFSQFTSMLDLIEKELKRHGYDWVRISGDTDDRRTPVERFQRGEVPLFLISLKAGGTGLNLTAADTVIHYDPWWNPAVENQATDRAHRIGQDKPVFVYKLVATGTVEEKILELQDRKADLAERLLSGAADSLSALSAEDIEWMLK